MKKSSLRVVTYGKAELAALIESEWFQQSANIPISRLRAISQLNNPRLKETDVMLCVVYDGKDMAGYLGVLPDTIYGDNEQAIHCGWLSCLWVDEKRRGSGIAKLLLQTMMESWNDQILITNFTEEAGALYERSGRFGEVLKHYGKRFYLRFDTTAILKPKLHRVKFLAAVLPICDRLLNALSDWRLKESKGDDFDWRPITFTDQEVIQLVVNEQRQTLFRRGVEELQWIQKHPWLTSSEEGNDRSRYYFSLWAARFENRLMGLYEHGKLTSILFITVRNGFVTVPYFLGNASQSAAAFIVDLMIRERLNTLTVFDEGLRLAIETDARFLYQRAMARPYVFSKKLLAQMGEIDLGKFRDGDGDAVFT